MAELAPEMTIIIVTHSMQQAARISDYTAFFLAGSCRRARHAHRVWSNRRDLHQPGGLADGRLYHRPLWLIGATSPKPIGSGPVRIHCAGGMTAPN